MRGQDISNCYSMLAGAQLKVQVVLSLLTNYSMTERPTLNSLHTKLIAIGLALLTVHVPVLGHFKRTQRRYSTKYSTQHEYISEIILK
jgi:hypothetical protein